MSQMTAKEIRDTINICINDVAYWVNQADNADDPTDAAIQIGLIGKCLDEFIKREVTMA